MHKTMKTTDTFYWIVTARGSANEKHEFNLVSTMEMINKRINEAFKNQHFELNSGPIGILDLAGQATSHAYTLVSSHKVADFVMLMPEVLHVKPLQSQFETFKVCLDFDDVHEMRQWVILLQVILEEHLLANEFVQAKVMKPTANIHGYLQVKCTPRVAELIGRMSGVKEVI